MAVCCCSLARSEVCWQCPNNQNTKMFENNNSRQYALNLLNERKIEWAIYTNKINNIKVDCL